MANTQLLSGCSLFLITFFFFDDNQLIIVSNLHFTIPTSSSWCWGKSKMAWEFKFLGWLVFNRVILEASVQSENVKKGYKWISELYTGTGQ